MSAMESGKVVHGELSLESKLTQAGIRERVREYFGGMKVGPWVIEMDPTTAAMLTPEQQRERFEAAWAKGGLFDILGIFADQMVNPEPAMKFAAAANAPVLKLDTPCGHIAVACISVGPTVARFLADPASAHSEVLQEAKNH